MECVFSIRQEGSISNLLNIIVFAGQDSPIHHIRESKTLIWARWPEEQELQSSRSVQNTDRNSSTVDQNQAEPGSAQTPPPCNQHSDELPECSVCLLEIEEEDKSSRLPCSHQFHNDCITRWMEQSRTCPLCRDGVNHHIWVSVLHLLIFSITYTISEYK